MGAVSRPYRAAATALFHVFADVFRSHDMGGFAKALWVLFVIFAPFLGVLVYLIARGKSMTDRDIAAAQAQQEEFKKYVQQTAGTGPSVSDRGRKWCQMRIGMMM